MVFGPVSAGYPGKWTFYAFIAAVTAIYGTVVVRFLRQKRVHAGEASETTKNKPSREVSSSQILAFGILCLILIVIALWSIHVHRPF
jgi:hypothetical protein